jgi:Tol biopolymer transport system component
MMGSVEATIDVGEAVGADGRLDDHADVGAGDHPDVGLDDGTMGSDGPVETGVGDVVGPDTSAESGPPPCNPSNSFGTPVLVGGIESSSTEGGLRLTPDELTAYFWSSRSGGPGSIDLYVATRGATNLAFGNVLLLNVVNSPGTQYDPTVTGDALTLMFGSNRASDAGLNDLFMASRAAASVDFSNASPISILNTSGFSDEQPFVLPDGSEIYFASNRTGSFELYRAFATGGQFGAPAAIAELNGAAGNNEHPAVTADDLTLVFSSTRSGGQGSNDIWMADRANAAATFGAAVNLTSINTSSKDIPDWLSEDRCRLYFHSDRSGATHEYIATRP